MARPTPATSFALALLFAALASNAYAQPVMTGVLSRMSHGGTQGTGGQIFDLPLPQAAPYGIECRQTLTGMNVVATFDRQVTAGSVAVTAGTAGVNGAPIFAGNTMTIRLAGVANAQQITLTLSNVTDPNGGVTPSIPIIFRTLEGDCNGSGSITVGDINVVKFYVNQTLNYANYRADLNLSGSITTGDINIVKAKMNASVPNGKTYNTPPTITNITDQSTPAGTATASVPFTVGDLESPAENLYVFGTSSNPALIPDANIVIGGTGGSRNITITPVNNQTGVATITVTVSDGIAATVDTFIITVGQPQKLYVATLRPENDTIVTSGSGSATLLVSGDETSAVLRVNYANLTTNKTGMHIHLGDIGVAGPIIFDIDVPPPGALQPDGSWIYTFVQSGNLTVADIVDALHNGRLYLNVHTVKNPAGEIRGQFNFATGSILFTPPPPAPPIAAADLDLATEPQATYNAVRFLTQATFGATNNANVMPSDIAHLKAVGFDAWLTEQFNVPTTSMLGVMTRRIDTPTPNYTLDQSNITDIWWATALGGTDYTSGGARLGDDQLRQRVAMALSEIFVVSRVEEAISGEPLGLASYHDTLANDAFGNFRLLLEHVTLHPIMGQYLNMKGNKKKANATAPDPNENYAREILQLFSIGLNNMHPDGTLKLDNQGLPIPTYDQSTIQNFARVFTGWDVASPADFFNYYDSNGVHHTLPTDPTYPQAQTRYIKPMTVNSGNHDFNAKTLLNGQIVPAKTASVANANDDLDNALDNVFFHANVGPFIARRLIQRLVTSNPSPGYIYRVATVFNDNGSGVRGDLKAVVKAILMDYEARSSTMIGNQGFGKVKEPLLRLTQVMRAFHPFSNAATPLWRMPGTTTDLGQTIYNANTVFNFFEPDYVTVTTLTSATTGQPYTLPLNTPEMQIVTENTTIYLINMMKRGIIDNTGFTTSTGGSTDVRLNFATESALTPTNNVDNLLDALNGLLMAGQMPNIANGMRDKIKTYVTTAATVNNADERARVTVYLMSASPQAGTQK